MFTKLKKLKLETSLMKPIHVPLLIAKGWKNFKTTPPPPPPVKENISLFHNILWVLKDH